MPPPSAPARDELEALIKEARARQRRRRLKIAAAMIGLAGLAALVYAFTAGRGPSRSTAPASPSGIAPSARRARPTPDQPVALAISRDRGLYLADFGRNEILEWSPSGGFRIIAGTSRAGLTGDGGPARRAEINSPTSLAATPNGTVYFTQSGHYRAPAPAGGMPNTVIREVTPGGTIHTIAGLHPNCRSRAPRSIPAESALFNGASLSLSPSGALAVDTYLCVDASHKPELGPHLLLTASGRFVSDTSNLVPKAAWQVVDCGIGVAGPGFHAFACESGLRHPKQLLVVRRDGSAATYAAYRHTEFAVGRGEVIAAYNDRLVRVTSRRLVPLLTHDELLRALHTRLIWGILAPTVDANGDIYFVASIENTSRSGCQSLILERTIQGTIRQIWASPAGHNNICY
jgi:hypothetical protein